MYVFMHLYVCVYRYDDRDEDEEGSCDETDTCSIPHPATVQVRPKGDILCVCACMGK